MFDSLPTLHNCFIFPNVTTNMSVDYNDFAPELHYLDPERNATANNVVKRLDECLSRYYETLTDHEYEIPPYYSSLYSFSNDTYWENGYGSGLVDAICAVIPTSINPDVGGIGVSERDSFSHRCSRS